MKLDKILDRGVYTGIIGHKGAYRDSSGHTGILRDILQRVGQFGHSSRNGKLSHRSRSDAKGINLRTLLHSGQLT